MNLNICSKLFSTPPSIKLRSMKIGKVKCFNPNKGYGFIKPQVGSPDIFVHISDLKRAGYTILNDNQTILYEINKLHRLLLKS